MQAGCNCCFELGSFTATIDCQHNLQRSGLHSGVTVLSYLRPVTPLSHDLYVFSFFQDGLKTADKLKQYIEKLAADLYNVSTFL